MSSQKPNQSTNQKTISIEDLIFFKIKGIQKMCGNTCRAARLIGVTGDAYHKWMRRQFIPTRKNIRLIDAAYDLLISRTYENYQPATSKTKSSQRSVDTNSSQSSPATEPGDEVQPPNEPKT